jgi:hypothetical protein
MDLAKEGEVLLLVRYLNPTLYAELGLIEPVKLMFNVRQVPPAERVLASNTSSTSTELVRGGQLVRLEVNLGGADKCA